MQRADSVRRGTEAALGNGQLGEAWGDATARFDEEAEIAVFNINSQRAIKKAMIDIASRRMPMG
jgi:hypothetical protein